MTPIELKQWQADLGLSEAAMAHYLGIPVHTLKKWINGTRKPDAAPLRLFAVLRRIMATAPGLHLKLIQEAHDKAPDMPPAKRGRPVKGIVAILAENAPGSPESIVSEIPDWMRSAL